MAAVAAAAGLESGRSAAGRATGSGVGAAQAEAGPPPDTGRGAPEDTGREDGPADTEGRDTDSCASQYERVRLFSSAKSQAHPAAAAAARPASAAHSRRPAANFRPSRASSPARA
eukprot:scaffold7679_cov51-Isochrysis_galbana.AAC.1